MQRLQKSSKATNKSLKTWQMKRRHAARNENKNATKLQSCKLQVASKILSTAIRRADSHEKRNPQLLV